MCPVLFVCVCGWVYVGLRWAWHLASTDSRKRASDVFRRLLLAASVEAELHNHGRI